MCERKQLKLNIRLKEIEFNSFLDGTFHANPCLNNQRSRSHFVFLNFNGFLFVFVVFATSTDLYFL